MKLVHLTWVYYKEICYDARSHERKKKGSDLLPVVTRIVISSVVFKHVQLLYIHQFVVHWQQRPVCVLKRPEHGT